MKKAGKHLPTSFLMHSFVCDLLHIEQITQSGRCDLFSRNSIFVFVLQEMDFCLMLCLDNTCCTFSTWGLYRQRQWILPAALMQINCRYQTAGYFERRKRETLREQRHLYHRVLVPR